MSWIQLHVSCNKAQTELVEDLLLFNGALSVTFEDKEDQPILEPGVGETPLWNNVNVTALFDQATDETVIQEITSQLSQHNLKVNSEILEEQDWERSWLDQFHPMQFGAKLWVCPSWHQPVDPNAINIKLDPGLAFGTGNHETTSICLSWLDKQDLRGKTITDFGCGSGILAIAGLLLGASHARCIDNDPQALSATASNMEKNGLNESHYLIVDAGSNQLPERTDLTIANILAKTIIDLKSELLSSTKDGGSIMLSGILENQIDEVIQALSPEVSFDTPEINNGWAGLSGTIVGK